jgi:ferredoxin
MARIPYVDQDACISCGLCVDSAPEVFCLNNANLAKVFDPTGLPEVRIQEVMDGCPVSCIFWQE